MNARALGEYLAFPRSPIHDETGYRDCGQDGMTLREWYAGLALQGLLCARQDSDGVGVGIRIAQLAVTYADALLSELAESGMGKV